MRYMTRFFLTVIFVLISINAVFAAENFEYFKVANEWRSSISGQVLKPRSQEFQVVTSFMEDHIANGKFRPIIDAIEALEVKKKDWIFIVPILRKEKEICESWGVSLLSSPAQFFSGTKSILVDGNAKYSSFGKKVSLAREYYRSYATIRELYSPEEYWEMELDAQNFQLKFIDLSLGEKYRQLVHSEAKKIEVLIDINKHKNYGYSLPGLVGGSKEFDAIFKTIASDEERKYLKLVVWIKAVFVYIEDSAEKTGIIREEKMAFLRSIDFYNNASDLTDFPREYYFCRKK